LLRSQKDFPNALTAYEQVGGAPEPDPEILQKANLGAGEVYDLIQKRDLAIKKYQDVVSIDPKTNAAESARQYMKDPYRGD
jgi:tetratricopeptide (TPR) repeat protein